MKRYINVKACNKVETVLEIDSTDFQSFEKFNLELNLKFRSLSRVYSGEVYVSRRCDKQWSGN